MGLEVREITKKFGEKIAVEMCIRDSFNTL